MEIERILVITAHPDDVDFGAGGTVRQWTRSGIEVSYCVCTDGDAGGADRDVPRSEIPRIRRAEQRAAGAALGVTDIHFLGYKDGDLQVTQDLRRDISRVIRQVKPQRVLMQSPERNWDRIYSSHPDHLAAGEAAICSVYPDARNPHAHVELMAEGHEPHAVDWVWITQGRGSNLAVNITDVMDKKVAALSSHASQVEWIEDIDKLLRDWAAMTADKLGVAEQAPLVEAFTKIQTH